MNKENKRTDRIPAAAFTLKAGDVTLEMDGDPLATRVSLLARSSKPIDHWYWGRVVHQFAADENGRGAVVGRDRIPIDYAHNADEIIGFLDSFTVEPEGLRTDGQLVVFRDDDRAAEIAYKSAQGVPFEASINFGGDGIELEEIADGETTSVNGTDFSGPGVVVRSWPLRGVAIVPYGADQNTESTVFNSGDEIVVEFLSKGDVMPRKKKPAAEKLDAAAVVDEPIVDETATDQQVDEQVTDEPVADEITAEVPDDDVADETDETDSDSDDQPEIKRKFALADGQRFIEAFGEQGAVWFVEGLSFADGQQRFTDGLIKERDGLFNEVLQLRQQLDALNLGETDPVEFSEPQATGDAERAALVKEYSRSLPPVAAQFAARFESRNGRN